MSLLNSSADMTIGEFVEEASVFGLTSDFYDFLKEAHELDLTESYINMTTAVMESGIETTDSEILTESASQIEVITEGFMAKVGDFFKKAGNILLKALKAVGTFFKRVAMSWKNGKEIDEFKAKVEGMSNLTASQKAAIKNDISAILDAYEAAKQDGDQQIAVADRKYQELANKIGLDSPYGAKLMNCFSYASDSVKIEVPVCVCEIEDISKTLTEIFDSVTNLKEKKENGASQATINTNGRKIDKKIAEVTEQLGNAGYRKAVMEVSPDELERKSKIIDESIAKIQNDLASVSDFVKSNIGNKFETSGGELYSSLARLAKDYSKACNRAITEINIAIKRRDSAKKKIPELIGVINKARTA